MRPSPFLLLPNHLKLFYCYFKVVDGLGIQQLKLGLDIWCGPGRGGPT